MLPPQTEEMSSPFLSVSKMQVSVRSCGVSAHLPLSDASEIMQRGQKLEENTRGGWRQKEQALGTA